MEAVTAWQGRPPEPCHPVVSMDASGSTSAMTGRCRTRPSSRPWRCCPTARDVLGLWFQADEGAEFWAKVLDDLRNRGAQDIVIAVVDGLEGFPQAIEASFPRTQVQTRHSSISRAIP